jgi:hypothetical protein
MGVGRHGDAHHCPEASSNGAVQCQRVVAESGHPASATSTMVSRRRTSRVCMRDMESSHPKNLTRDGAWLSQMKHALAEVTPPKLRSL